MKKHLSKIITFVLTLSISAVLVSASIPEVTTTTIFKVDFDFQIGNAKYSKGKYKLSRGDKAWIVVLQNLTQNETKVLLGTPPSGSSSDKVESRLSFNRYGNKYFLREVVSPVISAKVRMSRDEKKVRKHSHKKLANINIKSEK